MYNIKSLVGAAVRKIVNSWQNPEAENIELKRSILGVNPFDDLYRQCIISFLQKGAIDDQRIQLEDPSSSYQFVLDGNEFPLVALTPISFVERVVQPVLSLIENRLSFFQHLEDRTHQHTGDVHLPFPEGMFVFSFGADDSLSVSYRLKEVKLIDFPVYMAQAALMARLVIHTRKYQLGSIELRMKMIELPFGMFEMKEVEAIRAHLWAESCKPPSLEISEELISLVGARIDYLKLLG